jgi:hypothetical protein
MDTLLITLISLFSNLISQIQNFPIQNQQSLNIFLVTDRKMCFNFFLFARLYSIWLFTTSVSKMVSSVYSLLTINSMVSNFWCSRTVSKVYSKLIDYYNNFYVDGS